MHACMRANEPCVPMVRLVRWINRDADLEVLACLMWQVENWYKTWLTWTASLNYALACPFHALLGSFLRF